MTDIPITELAKMAWLYCKILYSIAKIAFEYLYCVYIVNVPFSVYFQNIYSKGSH